MRPIHLRLSALCLPLFFGGEHCLFFGGKQFLPFVAKARMRMHRENEIAFHLSRVRGEVERAQRTRVRGPLRDSELTGSLWRFSDHSECSGSGGAPSPRPLPARGEREQRASREQKTRNDNASNTRQKIARSPHIPKRLTPEQESAQSKVAFAAIRALFCRGDATVAQLPARLLPAAPLLHCRGRPRRLP